MPPVNPTGGKLSFSAILSQSFRFFFANLRIFFHLVTIPWILSLVLRIGGSAIESSLIAVLAKTPSISCRR